MPNGHPAPKRSGERRAEESPSPQSPETSPQEIVEEEQPDPSAPATDADALGLGTGDWRLAELQRERDEYLALAQRTQADFENYRKRAAKEAAAAGERAKSGLVSELLPVVDNLERALESAGKKEEHLADGVRLVHSELIAVLSRNGVEQFDPKGEKFDPTYHEALSTRDDEDAGAGTVLDVVEKGYRLNGTVLRPARVVVSG